jgi:CxxC motif-containing protein (DUF1111 family)
MKSNILWMMLLAGAAVAQPPRNPRPAPPATGTGAIGGLTPAERGLFERGRIAFGDTEGVADGIGPRFNLDSCVGCHAHPSIGGTSPAINPQIAAASRLGAQNLIPPFIRADGPVRVVRFRQTPDGRPDGGVHSLFVISGRSDAPAGCRIAQPDFSRTANLTFRIPTPVFGGGLIESIPDSTLRANLARANAFGIQGRLNTNGNDGTVTRFGWKAQNKSLAIFSGEAYNVEMGVTNELFPQERDEDPACSVNATPEDHTNAENGAHGDAALFTFFMRFLAPPAAGQPTAATERGRALFDAVGCAACHTPVLRTGRSSTAALSNRDVALYSDLALHRMGQALDDGITQGDARGQDWRTAPLWGLGSRLFFLHDGRTRDLNEAIRLHDSPGSEARQVIQNYQALTPAQREDLLAFLRSL